MAVAVLPAVWGEFRFNRLAYWLSHERSPERRQMEYLRQIGASADSAKEVKLFGLGNFLVGRFKMLADAIYHREPQAHHPALRLGRAARHHLDHRLLRRLRLRRLAHRSMASSPSATWCSSSGSFGQLNGYFQQILIGFTQIAGQALYLDDLYSFFDIKPTITEPAAAASRSRCRSSRGSSSTMSASAIPAPSAGSIRNLNLTIKAGETVALVGENGAGKTTIVKLMTRLYEAEEGRITIDGIDIREFSSADLRRHIGVIFQDFLRYSFTARDNIGVGRIEAAARPRRASPVRPSRASPTRSSTSSPAATTSNWASSSSAARTSRAANGRSSPSPAPICARPRSSSSTSPPPRSTPAPKPKSSRASRSLARAATALLISHRFSTVRMADRIVVLDEGKVLEAGTHEELMALRGHYAELFELQAAGYR